MVIAESTRKLLGNLFDFQDLGAQDLKGTPVRAWAALRPASPPCAGNPARTIQRHRLHGTAAMICAADGAMALSLRCSIRGVRDRAELKFVSQHLSYETVAEFACYATRKNATNHVVPRLQNPDEH